MSPEIMAARKVYRWLWLSPFLTIPTLLFLINSSNTTDARAYLTSILISSLWHAIFLRSSLLNSKSALVRWHGLQALLLAGLRTAIPFVFVLRAKPANYDNAVWSSIPLLIAVWFIGTLWGQSQAKTGISSLQRWYERVTKSKVLSDVQNIEYLLAETQNWPGVGDLRKPYAKQLKELKKQLFPPAAVPTEPAKDTSAEIIAPVPLQKAATVESKAVSSIQASPQATLKPVPKPKATPKPAAPPKPKKPPINWRKVITEAATSGALLRALLYLGAFMIVVSASVLVIRFWNQFNPVLQLVFIASVPLMFYAGGWLLRSRLKLTQAGTVLTGIGAVLVAVDFAAVYQLGVVDQAYGRIYWFIMSAFCTALYAFTASRLPGEFFHYLSLLGGASILFTFTRLFNLSIEWSTASVTASATTMTILAGRLKNHTGNWVEFTRAARYLSQILIPFSVVFLTFSWRDLPILVAFMFATIGYCILAWQFPKPIFAYASLGASIGTVIFALRITDLSLEWYSTVGVVLALTYILIGQRVKRVKVESNIIQSYVKALSTTGLILTGAAIFGGLITSFYRVWPAVIALALASLDLAVCAYFFEKSRYTFFASGLFVAPFSLALYEWLDMAQVQISPEIAWLTIAWGGLAFAYIGLAAVLRRIQKQNRWLYLWAHFLTASALVTLPFGYLLDAQHWSNTLPLLSLGMSIAIYLTSFFLHDRGDHPSLSAISIWLPYHLGKAIFLWPAAILFPIWIAILWYSNKWPDAWFGVTLVGLAMAYVGIGQLLSKRAGEYRLPFHMLSYLLCVMGIPLSVSNSNQYPLSAALLLTVTSAALLAYVYNRVIETSIASLLFIWSFQLALDIFKIPSYSQALAYVLLGSLAYIPIALYLNKFQKSREGFHPTPIFIAGYALTVFAVSASLIGRTAVTYLPWIGVTIPIVAAALYLFSASYFKASRFAFGWAWASALTFAIAFGQALTLLKVPAQYQPLAWAGLAAFYVLSERALFFASRGEERELHKFWSGMLHMPMVAFALAVAILGLALSIPHTSRAFAGIYIENILPYIVAQIMIVLLTIASARLYQQRWLLYIEPMLAFLPVTLFFIGYGEQIFGKPLTTPQYALAWTGLGMVHFIAAAILDRAKVRYAQGLFLGAYILLLGAVLWSVIDRTSLVWTFGLSILVSTASALLIHYHKHNTWDEFVGLIFGESQNRARLSLQNIFQWFAAWTFPIWCVILLREIKVSDSFSWLGLALAPLAYLGLVLWLRRIDSSYALPLNSAAQFYTALGLLISMGPTINFLFGNSKGDHTHLAFTILQVSAGLFYAASAWIYQQRGFAHVSAWLSIVPFTIAWKLYGPTFTSIRFVIPWLIWSSVLLLCGFVLDRQKVRYAHGPYLAGYVLLAYALARSTPDRLTNIYALAITISLALLSYIILHFGHHHSYEDFVARFWRKADSTTQSLVSTLFLFLASYALPVLLAQLLTHIGYPLAWRGVSLALVAPLYIAFGLVIRRFKPRSGPVLAPTWALYSAGYTLTAIGAMVTFGDERLATYLLVLNAIVYAVSAYIFQQAFWLYLSTVLTPIVALLVLHQASRLESAWIAWIFMGISYLYLGLGQLLDKSRKPGSNANTSAVHHFAAPFYAPGFLLSAVALAAASGERNLAIQIYSAGVIFYALSGFLFRETLFIYPASWLASVPYFLAITLTSLEVRWYGLAWLPLIVLYIMLGRFIFHKRPLAPLGQGLLIQWLTHPAVPFYLVGYGLSVSMISLSYVSPLGLTIAFAAGAILYAASAFLFGRPGWFYVALFALHMTLLASFTINPQGGKAYYLSIPFLVATWVTSLLGYGFSRWIAKAIHRSNQEAYKLSLLNRLLGHPWARPFFVFATIEMIFWQSVALNGADTTIIVGCGHALLLALFALLWAEGSLVYGVVGFSMLAVGATLKQAQVPFADAVAIFGGIGFGLYLFGRILEWISARIKALTVWLLPLTHSSVFLTAAAVVVNLPLIVHHTTATAAALAFAGALYVTIAYRERRYAFGYFGMALLEVAWILALRMNDISQPQFYAIPGGLYFLGIGYLELQRSKKRYAIGIELFGLGVLLLTSFMQSLNGQKGFPYFVLMLLESLVILWWGTIQKRKIPFFAGIGATALNIIAQTIILIRVYDINRWIVAFGVGLIIMGIAIGIERGREQLRARSRQWSERLEKWE